MNDTRAWLDTNVIIRFLTDDDEAMASDASHVMRAAESGDVTLYVHPIVIAECCWVLTSTRYGYSRADVADVLQSFLSADGIQTPDYESVLRALDLFARCKIDYTDAFLSALALDPSGEVPAVVTFNTRDFERAGARAIAPRAK